MIGVMMSVREYKYQKASHEQLLKCMKWCLNEFQLRDWQVDLCTGDVPPKEFRTEDNVLVSCGWALPDTNKLKAIVWVNLPRHIEKDLNPYATVIHETLHIFLTERGEDSEQVVRILEPMLYELYCRGAKIKLTAIK